MITEDVAESRYSAVRQFASGVAVLTLADQCGAHGVTVSALTAVSRQPLLIGMCLNPDSSFLRRVQDRRWFSVNVLNAEQAPLARWFANPQRPHGSAQFDGIRYRSDPASDAPLIDGALSHLTCRLSRCLLAGDQVLVLATVVSGEAGTGFPLLCFARALHGASTPTRPEDCRFANVAAAGHHNGSR